MDLGNKTSCTDTRQTGIRMPQISFGSAMEGNLPEGAQCLSLPVKLGDFHLFRALRIMRGKMSLGYEYRIGVSPENGIGDL